MSKKWLNLVVRCVKKLERPLVYGAFVLALLYAFRADNRLVRRLEQLQAAPPTPAISYIPSVMPAPLQAQIQDRIDNEEQTI